MGGFYGHMLHPFEDLELTFGDIKKMIAQICDGTIKKPKEKMDGINCFVTYNEGPKYARNKSHFINGGVTIAELVEKYENLPKVIESFVDADKTLNEFFTNNKQCQKFLRNRWLDIEIINRENTNVIDYHGNFIVFHDIRTKNNNIIPAKHIELYHICKNTDLLEIIHSPSGDIGYRIPKNNYTISIVEGKLHFLPIDAEFKYSLLHFLDSIMLQYMLEDKNTVLDYYYNRYGIKSNIVLKNLHNNQLEELFTRAAIQRIKNTTGFLTLKPILAKFTIKQRIENIISDSEYINNTEVNTLFEKIKMYGGIDSIIPSEGIIFTFRNRQYKLTGLFAYINQLLGIGRYRR